MTTSTAVGRKSVLDPESWVDAHGDALFRLALRRVRDTAIAEDLVQETLLAAMQNVESKIQISSERAWLIGILRHKVLDHFRRSSRDQKLYDASVDPADPCFDGHGRWSMAPGDWGTPEKSLEQDEFWSAFNLCIDALPQNLRTTFALREFDGIGSEELSKALGTTKNNLWVMLSRARQRLRNCLDSHWFRA